LTRLKVSYAEAGYLTSKTQNSRAGMARIRAMQKNIKEALGAIRDQIAASQKKEEREIRENNEGKPEPPKKVRVISKYDREY